MGTECHNDVNVVVSGYTIKQKNTFTNRWMNGLKEPLRVWKSASQRNLRHFVLISRVCERY